MCVRASQRRGERGGRERGREEREEGGREREREEEAEGERGRGDLLQAGEGVT